VGFDDHKMRGVEEVARIGLGVYNSRCDVVEGTPGFMICWGQTCNDL